MSENVKDSPLILIVDDEKITRTFLRSILSKEGYRTMEAVNGREALNLFLEDDPDVVLMDVFMPEMDGLTACYRLRTLPRGETVPVLIFTSAEDNRSVEKAFEAGADDFITKPINSNELKHRIVRLLRLREVEEAVVYQKTHDSLTGLPNRLLFKDRLTQAVSHAHRDRHKLAVLFMDLDQFKLINDTFGHESGDRLIKEIASKLPDYLPEGDTLARLGGDEFSVILPEIPDMEKAARIGESILEMIRRPWKVMGQELHITMSMGISMYPMDGEDALMLMRNAETAMYRHKQQGGNGFQFYTASMNFSVLERLALEANLFRAMKNQEFLLFYQPQFSLKPSGMTGMEALLRWDHPGRGIVPPAEFMNHIEQNGLIVPIGEWVLETACRQNVEWQKAGYQPIRMAVNISGRQFHDKNLLDTVQRILKETGLDGRFLELEITESVMMEDIEQTISLLDEFRAMGIQMAIDDFGTGYSSLSYLKRFPLTRLKIDRGFVKDILNNPDDEAIVATIIQLAHNLKLSVTAEGVETEEQLNFLRKRHCDEIQGYLVGRPAPPAELNKFFQAAW